MFKHNREHNSIDILVCYMVALMATNHSPNIEYGVYSPADNAFATLNTKQTNQCGNVTYYSNRASSLRYKKLIGIRHLLQRI